MTNHLRRSLITTIPLAVIGFVVRIPGTARAFQPPANGRVRFVSRRREPCRHCELELPPDPGGRFVGQAARPERLVAGRAAWSNSPQEALCARSLVS